MELIRENVKVELEDIGEGISGDYNPDDPNDTPLLRFYVLRKDEDGEWQEYPDGSYCTQINAETTSEERQREILEVIMDRVFDEVSGGVSSIKKACEELSWLE